MDNILNTDNSRDRAITSFNGIPSFLRHILDGTKPHLQIQYNDENNKCINRSPVLTTKNKIVTANDLHQTTFVPKNINDSDLVIPSNAKTILIFGQIGNFASTEDAMCKLCPKPFDPKYRPTCGIEISGPFYLGKTPMKLVFAIFDLETGKRISSRYCNDIIDSIEFKDGRFHQLTTTESVNCVL